MLSSFLTPHNITLALLVSALHLGIIEYLVTSRSIARPQEMLDTVLLGSILPTPTPKLEQMPLKIPAAEERPEPIFEKILDKPISKPKEIPIEKAVKKSMEKSSNNRVEKKITGSNLKKAKVIQSTSQSEMHEVVVAPSSTASYLNNAKPTYPALSKRLGEEGRTLLRVLVTAQGVAGKVEVKHSSGFARLDQAAQKTVRTWHFVPAKRGGVAIEMWYDVPINFSINS